MPTAPLEKYKITVFSVIEISIAQEKIQSAVLGAIKPFEGFLTRQHDSSKC